MTCDGIVLCLKIKEVINRRQTMNIFETDLERWIQKREELSHRADQLKLQRDQLLQATEVCSMTFKSLVTYKFVRILKR